MKKTLIYIILAIAGLLACKSNQPSTKDTTKQSSTTKESSKEKEIVKIARSYVGVKYQYGGVSNKGVDCSGLSHLVYKDAGIILPRISQEQSKFGKRVYIGELRKGDLIFFGAKPGSKKITHIGIVSYFNNGYIKMIHASSSKGVREDVVDDVYWRQRYIKASRPLSI